MKKTYPGLLLFSVISLFICNNPLQAQSPGKNWQLNPFEQKAFVENMGQFNGLSEFPGAKVFYGADNLGVKIYFSDKGITYSYEWNEYTSDEGAKFFPKSANERDEDKKGIKHHVNKYSVEWLNINPSVKVIAEGRTPGYYNYAMGNDASKAVNFAPGFSKLIYKDIYPGIDMEYIFHEKSGLKYSFIVHAGADPSKIALRYKGFSKLRKDDTGDLVMKTAHGDFTDHAPLTYYKSGTKIPSAFMLVGDIATIKLGNYNTSSEIIIDPWANNPNLSSVNRAYDIHKDGGGNVYVYGGSAPFKLLKYTAGGAFTWSLNTPYSGWYGDLTVDGLGNAYIAQGWVNDIARVSNAGVLKWNATHGGVNEHWALTLNCGGSKLSAAGGCCQPFISIIDTSNGTKLSTNNVSSGATDVRTLVAAANTNYYLITANNQLIAATNAYTTLFTVATGYAWTYSGPAFITNGSSSGYGGRDAMDVSRQFIFTTNGATVYKRDITTGASLGTVAVPSGVFEGNDGIATDSCSNIYVGSSSAVYKFDSNLNQITSQSTTGAVYCVAMGSAGEILACGDGFIASLTFSACPLPVGSMTAAATGVNSTCANNNGSASASATGGSGAYTYSWVPSGQTGQTATGLSAGSYTVFITDGSGCMSNSATVSITGGGLNLTTQSNNILCAGQTNGTASITSSGGQGTYTYTWTNGATTQTATGLSAGSYTVTVTDSAGCSRTQAFAITAPTALAVLDSTANIQCNGNNTGSSTGLVSGGTGAYTYSWSGGQTSQSATGLSAGSYTLTVTDANGCTQTHTVNITQPNGMTVSGSGVNILCNGQSNGTASATATGGSGLYTYAWNNGQTTQTATGLTAGTYTVVISDINGCTKTQTVTINQPGAIVVTATGGTICDGECINITANGSGGTGNITYTWNPGNLSGGTVNVCPNSTTTYTVTATDANGCTQTQVATVTVNPKPVASFTANPTTGQVPLSVNFTNTSSGGTTYSWIFGDGNSANTQNATNTYTNGGSYNPMLIVTNTFGCKDTFMLTILADGYSEIIVPNVFSPNGDGYNELFSITSIGLKDLYVEIYDRWGLKMGDFSALNGGWDGKAASGKDAPEGTYYYILLAHGIDNKEYNLKGYLMLLRK